MKSHNRIPRSRILLVAVVVLLAVVICAELLAMRAMREKADASDVIQTLPEGDGETEPAAVDSAEPTDLRSPTESGETEPAAEGGSDPEYGRYRENLVGLYSCHHSRIVYIHHSCR